MQFNSPKNFKRGRLIANRYRKIDVLIAGCSISVSIVTILTYLLTKGKEPLIVAVLCLPLIVGLMMLIPYGVYHNLMVMIQLFLIWNKEEKRYIWEGVYKRDIW